MNKHTVNNNDSKIIIILLIIIIIIIKNLAFRTAPKPLYGEYSNETK